MARYRLGLAVFVSTAFLLFSPAAKAALVTLDIWGTGSGTLNSVGFENQTFHFDLEGQENGAGVLLSFSAIDINGLPTVSFSNPTLANLNSAPTQYAFLRTDTANGGLSTADDLVRFFFSPANFLALQNDSVFFGVPTSVDFTNFVNVATSGGPLTFTTATVSLFGVTSPNEITAGVPELSTWAMMLLGFAGVGFVAYRRARKASTLATG